jgi:hypothetical protein
MNNFSFIPAGDKNQQPKNTMTPIKPKIETKSIKHTFTPEEIAKLNVDFGQAFDALGAAEADFEAIKAVHKSKITGAETTMTTLRCTINAGFEMRPEKCVVVFCPKDSKKYYFLEKFIAEIWKGEIPTDKEVLALNCCLSEAMTPADFQAELIEAEAKFELREEIPLFTPANDDNGTLIVGRFGKRWYAALRVKIGTRILGERLDSEQPASKERFDAVKRGCKRFNDWLNANLGADGAKGFQNGIADVLAKHKEREE